MTAPPAAPQDHTPYKPARVKQLEREIERLREWQRRALVVIECPSSDTIQAELKWLREASKP